MLGGFRKHGEGQHDVGRDLSRKPPLRLPVMKPTLDAPRQPEINTLGRRHHIYTQRTVLANHRGWFSTACPLRVIGIGRPFPIRGLGGGFYKKSSTKFIAIK